MRRHQNQPLRIRNKAAERSARRPVIVALRGGELASLRRSPSLTCLAMSWDARASVKRGALPLGRANDPRHPKHTPAIMRIEQRCCPIEKVASEKIGALGEGHHRPFSVGYAASLVAIALRMSSVNSR
jgi:hypothetical protein